MDSKRKKGTKEIIDSRTKSVQPPESDMSKYARAVSNKSKINYAALKLAHHGSEETEKASEKASEKTKKRKKTASDAKVKEKRKKKTGGGKKPEKKKPRAEEEKKTAQSAVSTAEERYSNALESGDHYSSAVEKYYLKYPDVKRKNGKKAAPTAKKEASKKKRRRSRPAGDSSAKPVKRSMAEIAVSNKHSSSVKQHARAARNAKARGVITSKVGNRSFYKRRKRRSGALNVLMITLLLVFLVAVGVLVFFNIGQVRIEGDSPYSDAEIKSICAFRKGSNILFIDSEGTADRIMRELPYIEKCTIERRLPSTVTIKVQKADVLGVAKANGGQWAVLSSEGKILESSSSKGVPVAEAENGVLIPSDVGGAEELAALRMLPLMTDVDLKSNADGFLTGDSLERVKNYAIIRDAFKKVKLKLTSIGIGKRGYEAVYDERIVINFGKTIERRTVFHHMDEVYDIIFNQKLISGTDKGEFKFYKNKISFRHHYEVSEEELKTMNQQKHERNQKKLYALAEIFMSTGKDWLDGKLKSE